MTTKNVSAQEIHIRPVSEVDIGDIVEIDEKLGGKYRPEVWEQRVGYYLRRDPEVSVVAEVDDRVVGFMLGEVRSGEFGLEEPTGWVEVLGVDPEFRGQAVGRALGEKLLANLHSRGATTVRTLVADEMANLQGFFTSLGFVTAPVKAYVKQL